MPVAQWIRAQAAPMFIAPARLSIKPSSLATRQRSTICVVVHHSSAIAVVTYRLGAACGCWQAVRIGAIAVVGNDHAVDGGGAGGSRCR